MILSNRFLTYGIDKQNEVMTENSIDYENYEDINTQTEITPEMIENSISGKIILEDSTNSSELTATWATAYSPISLSVPYLFSGVKHNNYAIQNIYVTSNYVYATQRIDADSDGFRDDTVIGRFTISGAYAIWKDEMILMNCGHGETLDRYTYGGETYFLIGCKRIDEEDDDVNKNCWSVQIGRIKYSAGTTISNYTNITRLTNLGCANDSGTNSKDVIRVAAATSENNEQLVIRTVLKDAAGTYFQYSTYNLQTVNSMMDSAEATSSKTVSFKDNSNLTAVCNYSFVQPGDSTKVHPNDSFQGIEIAGSNIYVAGGVVDDDYPQIAKMKRATGDFISGVELSSNSNSYKNTEIEGLCYKESKLYFVLIVDEIQALCYVDPSLF